MSGALLDLSEGNQIGPYRVVRPLGRGAQARVYLVTDRRGRHFALKVRRRLQDAMDRRFLREFESMRLLRLPGVVQVHEAGLDGDWLWFSMDVVEGETFYDAMQRITDIRTRISRVISLGETLITILGALHEAGFVHRDVKPSNVMVDAAGEIRVLDFGIGRYFSDSDTLSHSGEVLGTVPYMSPEQLAGLPIDASVDLYAAGLMLYEAIGGQRPRPATTIGWIPRICLDKLLPLACTVREVPLLFSHVVERLTSVDPRERPSARDAANMLRRVRIGRDAPVWPKPPFLDPGDFWAPLEGALGREDGCHVWVIQGNAGSGRARLAEQVHRHGLMQGFFPVHLHCRMDAIGGPLEELLAALLGVTDEDGALSILGSDLDVLRRAWPFLPLPTRSSTASGEPPSDPELAAAIARVVQRAAERKELLLVWHGVERIDPLTARAVTLLATAAGERLGMLALHEPRWATDGSRALVQTLTELGAGMVKVPQISAEHATQLAASLCPAAPPGPIAATSAQLAIEAGWKALARWRGSQWVEPDASLWALACRDASVPEAVYAKIAGKRSMHGLWVEADESGIRLAGESARAMANARLSKLDVSAAALARVWQTELGDNEQPGEIAVLWLLAGQPQRAWQPAARAALEAERQGRFAEARRRLMLLRTLPETGPPGRQLAYQLAVCEARVSLRTDAAPRENLVDIAEALALSEPERQLCRLLHAEVAVRRGEQRSALVSALRVAAGCQQQGYAAMAARALLVVVSCRLALGQIEDASRDLERAERLLTEKPDASLQAPLLGWRAELSFAERNLPGARATCMAAISAAGQVGDVRSLAFSSARLGQVLRMLGRRGDAETQTRSAREAFSHTGDVVLDAETGLMLATLLAERGDSVGARARLDESTRRIRGLRLDHLLPQALRVALQIATLQGHLADANVALDAMKGLENQDPEIAASLVRWWRTQGDAVRALAEPGPTPGTPDTYGHTLWRIERARAALAGGMLDEARADVGMALRDATRRGYEELQLYAGLVAGACDPTGSDDVWDGLREQASQSRHAEIYLGAVELDARRHVSRGDLAAAQRQWSALLLRSEELGYRPGVEEALGWLGEAPDEDEATEAHARPAGLDDPTERGIRRNRLTR